MAKLITIVQSNSSRLKNHIILSVSFNKQKRLNYYLTFTATS